MPHPDTEAPRQVNVPRIEDADPGGEQGFAWSPEPPEVDVKSFYHHPEDHQEMASEEIRLYEQVTELRVPPLIRRSANGTILGRSRLWNLWTDSVLLQSKLEYLQSVSRHCMMDPHEDRFRW